MEMEITNITNYTQKQLKYANHTLNIYHWNSFKLHIGSKHLKLCIILFSTVILILKFQIIYISVGCVWVVG